MRDEWSPIRYYTVTYGKLDNFTGIYDTELDEVAPFGGTNWANVDWYTQRLNDGREIRTILSWQSAELLMARYA